MKSGRLFVWLQHVLPQHALSRLVLHATRVRAPWFKNWLVRGFLKLYTVDMSEAVQTNPLSYASFNEFFTRALQPHARPMAADPGAIACPVDGTISQLGAIERDQIVQAKGHHYSSTALVGGDHDLAARFHDGSFATLYLSPKDYHRIHMPCAGTLTRMIHVPGSLFSVNPVTARGVPGLFARNESVVCVFDSAAVGPFVLVLVGATIVGSMATVWHGAVNAPRGRRVREWRYPPGQVALKQGQEMGRFMLGSTVVLLFGKEAGLRFNANWQPGRAIRLGEAMAEAH